MKFVLTCILFIPFFVFNQTEDTACVYARWFQVKPNNVNSKLFCLDSTIKEEFDLISLIETLVESNKLHLFQEKIDASGNLEWVFVDYLDEKLKALNDSLNYSGWTPYFTSYGPYSINPILDEHGEPIIINDCFIYPPRETFKIRTKHISEIQIKEVQKIDNLNGKREFVATDIGFYIKDIDTRRANPLFWVNLIDLYTVIDTTINYEWLPMIQERKYEGFLTRQISCDEPRINYYESNHPVIAEISDSCTCILTNSQIRNRQNSVVKIPKNCPNGVKVYFEPGGTQTDLTLYKIVENMDEYYLSMSFAIESPKNFILFSSEARYNITYSPCHSYSEFKLTIE